MFIYLRQQQATMTKKKPGKGIQNFCEHMAKNDTDSVTPVLSSLKPTESRESKCRNLTRWGRECLVRQLKKIFKNQTMQLASNKNIFP